MAEKKWLLFTLLLLGSLSTYAQNIDEDRLAPSTAETIDLQSDIDSSREEKIDIAAVMLEHVLDSHDWHITDIPTGEDAEGNITFSPVALHLPWMLYDSEEGLVFAGSTHSLVEKGYLPHGMAVVKLLPGVDIEGLMDEDGEIDVHDWDAFASQNVHEDVTVIDMSITKTALQMILIGLLLLWLFTAVARGYTRRENEAPKGLQSFMEPIIVFVKDEVAAPYLGVHAKKFLPYLLTLFFFIWFSNLLGLTPLNSNIAGNISVTCALALITFVLTQAYSSKDHWKHIFNTPGVPWWLKFGIPLMPIVELIGLFTKPIALAIRLFANISAGHFMVLGLVSLIFIMGQNGTSLAGGLGIMPLSFAFTLVILALEMVVALIQPFIFTLLTAVFIGMAMESHDDHH